ncbi:MAG: flagellar export protein FliJ [Spirochaetaceae bacterium]|jgi:flagellar FliJ protein|nr:flagellar export protein FliJ [Spirochaetaceae bacterium]
MRRFSFDLEKILELRAYREREAKIELGRAVGVLTAIEREMQSLAASRSAAAFRRFAPGNDSDEIRRYDLYIRRLDAQRDRLVTEAAEAERAVETARQVFLEASRERKVFDKLREKRWGEYRAGVLAEETKLLDDVASVTTGRKAL